MGIKLHNPLEQSSATQVLRIIRGLRESSPYSPGEGSNPFPCYAGPTPRMCPHRALGKEQQCTPHPHPCPGCSADVPKAKPAGACWELEIILTAGLPQRLHLTASPGSRISEGRQMQQKAGSSLPGVSGGQVLGPFPCKAPLTVKRA